MATRLLVSHVFSHSAVSEPCIEVKRYMNAPNVTLQVLPVVEGILYANTVDGATTTLDFLEFFGEASNNFLPNGEPVLRYGDHILQDNHATHHNDGGSVCFRMVDGSARHGSCLFTHILTRI